MRPTPRDLALMVIVSLVLTGVVPNEAYPADITLISVGPRLGFSGQTFLGGNKNITFACTMWRRSSACRGLGLSLRAAGELKRD